MRINVAVPEEHVGPDVINAALESVTRLDHALIDAGSVPVFGQALDRVRWKPEPPGDEHFDHAKQVLVRGWGDCDDLAPWHAASLRASGADRGARAIVKKSGPKRWHAVVQRSDGRIEDPSAAAGMPTPGAAAVVGGILPLMGPMISGINGTFVEHPRLAVRPVFDAAGQHEAWEARADLPWHWTPGETKHDMAMVSLHKAPVAAQAVVGAVRGAYRLGQLDSPSDAAALRRLQAISDVAGGIFTHQELCGIYGPELTAHAEHVVGSIFSSIAHVVKKAAGTVAHVASPIVRNKYVQMAAAAAGQAFGVPAPATLAAMKAAGKGLALADKLTHTARKVSPAEAVAHLATHGSATFVHPKTGTPVGTVKRGPSQAAMKPPTRQQPVHPYIPTATQNPEGMSQLWAQGRMPLHPSALPVEFNAHIIPIP